MKPQFFILTGPNGAGKSTYGHKHVPKGTNIFNGDLVYAELLKKYPDYDPQKLKGGVPSRLEKERDEAIAQGKDFAFESNYLSNESMIFLLGLKRAKIKNRKLRNRLISDQKPVLSFFHAMIFQPHCGKIPVFCVF